MTRAPRRPYHHGDLRTVLVRTGLEVLEQTGLEELSLRGLAEAAGVSRSAPYAHFADKRALLAGMAEVGFDRFAEEMLRFSGEAQDAHARFLGVGRGYARFALANPNLFKLMFSAELVALKTLGELGRKSERTYGVFRDSLDAYLREAGLQAPPGIGVATLAWSCIHGLSMLMIEARLPEPRLSNDALVEEVTALFTRLLGAGLKLDG